MNGILNGSTPASTFFTDPTQHESAQDLVDDLRAAFGRHPARAVHAKGVMLEGVFAPNADARALSKAKVFAGGKLSVLVRFSDFTGIPDIPDNSMDANPRGMAIKFLQPGAPDLDLVTHSFNGFPTATSDEFGELLRAIGASGSGAAKPTPLDRFLDAHPIAKTFLTTQKPPPVSYATLSYFGVNAFSFIDRQSRAVDVRYRLVPRAGEHFLDAAALAAKGPDYLSAEIAERVAKGAIGFDWFAQIAGAGDDASDPSIAWPQTRPLVRLGAIDLRAVVADPAVVDRKTLFLPGNLPEGIEAADAMIGLRNSAYPLSYRDRQ